MFSFTVKCSCDVRAKLERELDSALERLKFLENANRALEGVKRELADCKMDLAWARESLIESRKQQAGMVKAYEELLGFQRNRRNIDKILKELKEDFGGGAKK